MKIRSVALIGAGAVGSYFIHGLTDRPGIDFMLVAEGDRLVRLREGVRINGRTYLPPVRTPQEAGAPDLILVAVKYPGLSDAVRMISEMISEDTMVISLLNGIDSEEIIGNAVGPAHMLYALMRIQAWRRDGEFLFDPEGTAGMFFGEIHSREKTERVLAVEELLDGTGIRCTFVPDIQGEIWNKYASNICRNLPQAMLGVGYGAYADSTHLAWIRDAMDEEVHRIAAAKGIQIPAMSAKAAEAWQTVEKSARFSTLQDLDAHRHTEVEMFLGVLLQMAEALGIPTPACAFAYHFIKAMEEKNDGKFDY